MFCRGRPVACQVFWATHRATSTPVLSSAKIDNVQVRNDQSERRYYQSGFETHSGDRVFDERVAITLHDAAPLPPIPAALRKSQYEFGFRFSPNGLK